MTKTNTMKNTKTITQQIILVISFLLITSASFAQLPDFDTGQNDSGTAAPISSLVALGLIAGAAYGIKKMR